MGARVPIAYYRFEGGPTASVAINSGSGGVSENGTLVNTPVRQHDTP